MVQVQKVRPPAWKRLKGRQDDVLKCHRCLSPVWKVFLHAEVFECLDCGFRLDVKKVFPGLRKK